MADTFVRAPLARSNSKYFACFSKTLFKKGLVAVFDVENDACLHWPTGRTDVILCQFYGSPFSCILEGMLCLMRSVLGNGGFPERPNEFGNFRVLREKSCMLTSVAFAWLIYDCVKTKCAGQCTIPAHVNK